MPLPLQVLLLVSSWLSKIFYIQASGDFLVLIFNCCKLVAIIYIACFSSLSDHFLHCCFNRDQRLYCFKTSRCFWSLLWQVRFLNFIWGISVWEVEECFLFLLLPVLVEIPWSICFGPVCIHFYSIMLFSSCLQYFSWQATVLCIFILTVRHLMQQCHRDVLLFEVFQNSWKRRSYQKIGLRI